MESYVVVSNATHMLQSFRVCSWSSFQGDWHLKSLPLPPRTLSPLLGLATWPLALAAGPGPCSMPLAPCLNAGRVFIDLANSSCHSTKGKGTIRNVCPLCMCCLLKITCVCLWTCVVCTQKNVLQNMNFDPFLSCKFVWVFLLSLSIFLYLNLSLNMFLSLTSISGKHVLNLLSQACVV